MIFIGDTHGLRPIFEIIAKNQYEGQNLIHIGDFGLGFNEITQDVRNLLVLDEALIDSNNHLYVIRGNHDNPIFWDKSKGLNLPKLHNLHLVDDYSVIKIENYNILFVGGAISIDRTLRRDEKPYPSWWRDEEFNLRVSKIEEIGKNTPSIDIIVTHTAPHFVHPTSDNVSIVNGWHDIEVYHGMDLKGDLKKERLKLSEMYNQLKITHGHIPKYWFYGHFHSSRQQIIHGTQFKLLNVNETYEM